MSSSAENFTRIELLHDVFYRRTLRSRPRLWLPGARADLADGQTPVEQMLERQFSQSLRPALRSVYEYPLSNGLSAVYREGATERQMRRFVLDLYRENLGALGGLRSTLRTYAQRAFEIGGQFALDILELDAIFELEDPDLLTAVREDAADLALPSGDISLSRTTANELGRVLAQQQEQEASWQDALRFLSGFILLRTGVRAAVIAETESVRFSRRGLVSAFAGNGISAVIHRTQRDEHVCPECWAEEGKEHRLRGVFNPMSGVPMDDLIPIHTGCRCYYDPVRDGWFKPALIWTGFAIDLLDG